MPTIERPELLKLYAEHTATLLERAGAALDAHGYDAVILHSGRVQPKSPFDDAEWPFTAVPAFAHWCPLMWPDSAVIVSRGQARLWAMKPTGFWERPTTADWALIQAGLDVEVVEDLAAIASALPGGKVAFVGHEPEVAAELSIAAEHVNPSDLVVALEDTRVHKTPYEVEVLAQASYRGAVGHLAAAAAFNGGERSELMIHLAFLKATQQDDADTPYKGTVALGEAAATLHHHVYEERPLAGSLLIDAGARVLGYGCDITRTYAAVDDGPSEAFGALIEGMDHLQRSTLGDIQLGMNYEALHDGCHQRLGLLLVDQGLVTCSAEAAVAEGITRAFFPHGLGHSLGVQVHDVSCRKRSPRAENPFLRHTADITAGQVFTIEPGLYFIESLLAEVRGGAAGDHVRWDVVDALAPFGGIRIEDDIYVRADDSIRNLTRDAFADASKA